MVCRQQALQLYPGRGKETDVRCWNRMHEKGQKEKNKGEEAVDRLAMNAMLAKQAGMSYGKWKALQPIVAVEQNAVPKGWQKCEECGVAFPPRGKKRFCDSVCRRTSYEKNRLDKKKMAEYMRQYREGKKVANNGK